MATGSGDPPERSRRLAPVPFYRFASLRDRGLKSEVARGRTRQWKACLDVASRSDVLRTLLGRTVRYDAMDTPFAPPVDEMKIMSVVHPESISERSTPIEAPHASGESSRRADETREAAGRKTLTFRWAVGETSSGDSIVTGCWTETAPGE
jgi:hypothetical protein